MLYDEEPDEPGPEEIARLQRKAFIRRMIVIAVECLALKARDHRAGGEGPVGARRHPGGSGPDRVA